jgi:hypothetical protein
MKNNQINRSNHELILPMLAIEHHLSRNYLRYTREHLLTQ